MAIFGRLTIESVLALYLILIPFMQRLNRLLRLRPAQTLSNRRPFPKPYANMSAAPSAAGTDTQAETVANTSGVTTESLQKTITEKLEAEHVDIEDMSGKNQCARRSSCFADADPYQADVARCFKP